MILTSHLRIITILQVLLASAVYCIGFTGQIVGVPSEIDDIQIHNAEWPVLNGANFQSRFNIELISLDKSSGFESSKAFVNKNFSFKFNNLRTGSYELLINSYDFLLSSNRYRILIDDSEIKAYEEYLELDTFNATSEVIISEQPLSIQIKGIKEYYEHRLGSITNMLMDSPFGFIFKNKIYTIIFVVCSAIMVTPYLISWVNPDFADHFQEVQERAENRKREERKATRLQSEKEDIPKAKKLPRESASLRNRR